jgi:D-3-phosphoglycerate dehydrogenase
LDCRACGMALRLTPHGAGLSKEAAIRMAISTARNVLAGIDGKLDPAMVVNREAL